MKNTKSPTESTLQSEKVSDLFLCCNSQNKSHKNSNLLKPLLLAKFAEAAKGKNGEEIGALLESSEEIANLHKSTSQAESNQTQADESTKVRDHFVALVNVNNTLYEVRTILRRF